MPAALRDAVLSELDRLIVTGKKCARSYSVGSSYTYWSEVPEEELRAFVTSGIAAVERIAGCSSSFSGQLPNVPKGGKYIQADQTVPQTVLGVLMSLREAVDAGLLQTLESRIRAAVEDDFLEQARHLLTANYYVAAMVLIGGVLEQRLREICARRGLAPAGQQLNPYNEALRQAGEYDQATWRMVQTVGDTRNTAAHGRFDDVQRAQVQEALRFVERILVEYPA